MGSTEQPAPPCVPPTPVIQLFFSRSFEAPPEAVLAGCNLWGAVGVRCAITSDSATANAQAQELERMQKHWDKHHFAMHKGLLKRLEDVRKVKA